MSPRNLGQHELRLFHFYTHCQLQMSHLDFYAKWDVTHAQMAQICGCSQPTVDRWFAGSGNYRSPEPLYLRRLAEMDLLWEKYYKVPLALRRHLCPMLRTNEKEPSP